MSALVPYAGRLAYAAGIRPGLKLAPQVIMGARNAYKYARAAYTIGRAARSYLGKRRYKSTRYASKSRKKQRLFSRTHVGEPNGATTCKADVIDSTTAITKDTRTLYTQSVARLLQGTEINNRLRQHVNLRGFKVCFELNNGLNSPMYCNIAVIAPKGTTTKTSKIDEKNFFRWQGNRRAIDFNPTLLSSLEFHCLPINTDDYTVLKHKRYRLGPNQPSAAFTTQSGNSYKNVDWYIPLKRQVRYDQTEGGEPTDGDVYVVYWFDAFQAAAGNVPQASAVAVSQRYTVYYREPKN